MLGCKTEMRDMRTWNICKHFCLLISHIYPLQQRIQNNLPGGFKRSVSMEASERVEGGGKLDNW